MADEDPSERIAREVVLATFAGDAKIPNWVVRRLTAIMEDVRLEPGETLFRAGAPPVHVYFVVDGEVTLSAPGQRDRVYGSRSALGPIDLLLERPLSRTAVAGRRSHLLRLAADEWLDLVEDSFELSRRIVTNIATGVHRLRLRPPPLGGFDDPPESSSGPEPPARLHLVDRIVLLRAVPLLATASIQALTSLAGLATEVHAAPGEPVLPTGAIKHPLLVGISGEVSATLGGHAATPGSPPAGRFRRGAMIGGAAALAPAAQVEVRAVSAARVLAIARDDYLDVGEEHFSLVRSALRGLLTEQDELQNRG